MTITIIRDDQNEKIIIGLDTSIPEQIEIGMGTVLFISGWCFHPYQTTHQIVLLVNGRTNTCGQIHVCCPDEAADILVDHGESALSNMNGFWFCIPCLPGASSLNHIHLCLSADRENKNEILLGTVEFISNIENDELDQRMTTALSPFLNTETSQPLIAIGLATYNPDIQAFTRQINSIKNQSYPNWICLINDDNSDVSVKKRILDIIHDDNRFLFYSNSKNIGFYFNFERIVQLISSATPFIALCDQDDYWYPEKLMRLFQEFDNKATMLVYSDMHIVDSSGSLLSPSFWQSKVHADSLIYQILNNGITGASCMFRGELCEYLLPFPPDLGQISHEQKVAFHDHWIGSVALAVGGIKFINEPLYDYYQHHGNVAGYTISYTWYEQICSNLNKIRNSGFIRVIIHSHRKYLTHGLQKLCMSRIILIRIPNLSSRNKDQLIQFNHLFLSGIRMIIFLLTNVHKRKMTGDVEKMIFFGYISGKLIAYLMKFPFFRRVMLHL